MIQNLNNISFVSFKWFSYPKTHNEWSGRSIIPLENNLIYYWEVTINNLEKQYQYEYTRLGIITENGEKFLIDGLRGEIIHETAGQLRSMNEESLEEYRSNSSFSINRSNYRIRLKSNDTIGFLFDNRDSNNRSLAIIPRQNYSFDKNLPHTQPILAFSTQLLKIWELSTNLFGRITLSGRIPSKGRIYAYASIGQLGKRFEKKLIENLSSYIHLNNWSNSSPSSEIQLLLTNPQTTLSIESLSNQQYDERLIQRVENE